MGLDRVAERQLSVDAINIATPDSLALQNTAGFKFRDDFLHRSLGNPNRRHHIPQPHFRILGKAQ